MEKRKNRKILTQRKAFQGVGNIIRFNWHFFVAFFVFAITIFIVSFFVPPLLKTLIYFGIALATFSTSISLAVSYYVYDYFNLYNFNWLKIIEIEAQNIVNINAGFDEISEILQAKYPNSNLTVLDFYDAEKHTEVSIQRARKVYAPYPETKQISTNSIPLKSGSVDTIFLFMAAHEIRNEEERFIFFRELNRILKTNGQIIMVEHLQDIANFMAYNIGALHFQKQSTWQTLFSKTHFELVKEEKLTPFVAYYTLEKN